MVPCGGDNQPHQKLAPFVHTRYTTACHTDCASEKIPFSTSVNVRRHPVKQVMDNDKQHVLIQTPLRYSHGHLLKYMWPLSRTRSTRRTIPSVGCRICIAVPSNEHNTPWLWPAGLFNATFERTEFAPGTYFFVKTTTSTHCVIVHFQPFWDTFTQCVINSLWH
jgi:hypothetical protein